MQTSVEAIEVIDRNKDDRTTRMMSIRMTNGELKSHLLRRLLRDHEVVSAPRQLAWELMDEVRSLAIQCNEPPFPEPELAGGLAYLADHPGVKAGPGVLKRLLDRRTELRGRIRQTAEERRLGHRVPWLWER